MNLWGLGLRQTASLCGYGKSGAVLEVRRGRILQVLDGGTGGLGEEKVTTERTDKEGMTQRAPSVGVRRETQEHSQEWLCHR